ncbi:MAG: CCA tRNA nucleotidyltransferase [Thermoplasmata archaeon]|nr:MAG: CCA tRNA nucleotidyltransferase [Thermoplasmata archaeon]
MDHQELEQSVLTRITPSAEENEKIFAIKNDIEEKILKITKRLGLEGVKPMLVGSVAKDTHLKEVDLDIFIMFPASTPRDELEKMGLKIGYEILPDAQELYAEHPYLRGKIDEIHLDIVPCYEIKSSKQKLSAVDRTPFHMEYVINNLDDKLKPQVRLFKQFLKGIGAYGAEIRVMGFSGYLCEVLIIEYKGFHEVLEAALKWEVPGTNIVIPESIASEFDRATLAKFTEPLVVIDPIDVSRNVAAPVSVEILNLLKQAAVIYLAKPDERFFFPNIPKPMSTGELKSGLAEMGGLTVVLEIRSKPIVHDILFGQVRKSMRVVLKLLDQHDFSADRTRFFVEDDAKGPLPTRILLVLHLDTFELPSETVHRGPPVDHNNSNSFLDKWKSASNVIKEPYEKDGRWFVNIHREYTSALELIKDRFKTLNHGKQLNESVRNDNYDIYSGDELTSKQFAQYLTEFILNKPPWEY